MGFERIFMIADVYSRSIVLENSSFKPSRRIILPYGAINRFWQEGLPRTAPRTNQP